MHLAPSVTAIRWASIVVTALSQSVVLTVLLTGHTMLAGFIAVFGIALQAIVLALYNDRAVRATRRIAELESDLAVAHLDPVTGLAVRGVAERYLGDVAGMDVTVALIDVDGMHDVNTAHTHAGGDLYLAALAERLVRVAEPGDLVARLGGDEFVVVTPRDLHVLAWSLAAAVAPPVVIDSVVQPMRVSIGLCRGPGGDPHVAFGRADRAMYTAKRRGGGIEVYDPGRDGQPLPRGVRPAVRHRDRHAARHTANGS